MPRNRKSEIARGGGREPSQLDQVPDVEGPEGKWEVRPSEDGECRVVVCQITDVYTLEHLASFKTLVDETRQKAGAGTKVVSMLTGDFLSPYLLSSVDRGQGMMDALNAIPLDYLTWGNHEADINHRTVCRHVREFKGTWINSNMLDHQAMDDQVEYDVIDVQSKDGAQKRKFGLCAVLSDAPGLYSHFKGGPFGGATITDPWEALGKYKRILEEEEGCDFVLPLQHTYVPDDHKTCERFDFPVLMSGHDHHRVNEVVNGTRLLKPGMNGVYATILEVSWEFASTKKPSVEARFVKCSAWEPEPNLEEQNERAYDALLPLKNTELARVPPKFEPLSSGNSRGSVCTMGTYICSLLKSAMNVKRRQRDHSVDAVLLMGGNIRGNVDKYPAGSFFSLEALEAEIKADEVVGIVPMPGWLLAEGVRATHAGDPIPGWMQYDQGVVEDGVSGEVTHVDGKLIEPDRIYKVATKVGDLANGQCPQWNKYYTEHKDLLPPKGAYVNVQNELMSYFARNLWRKIWDVLTEKVGACGASVGCKPEERLEVLDTDGDGYVSIDELQAALKDLLGYSVDDREQSLARFVHTYADSSGDGVVSLEDFEIFCGEMDDVYKQDEWRLAFSRPSFSSKK